MRAHLSKAGSSAAGLRLGNGAALEDGLEEDLAGDEEAGE
jgi:hypothetical protein